MIYLLVYTWSGETISLSSSLTTVLRSTVYALFSNFAYTHSTISSFDLVSQQPSQPIIMKSDSGVISYSYVSGFAVIGCYSAVNSVFYLYFKSPRARVKLRLPSTRPSVIVLPAASILLISSSFSGLWSKLRGTALPPYPMTALESPAFATNSFFLTESTITTLAVHPIESSARDSSDCSPFSFLPPASVSTFNSGDLFGGLSRLSFATSCRPPALS